MNYVSAIGRIRHLTILSCLRISTHFFNSASVAVRRSSASLSSHSNLIVHHSLIVMVCPRRFVVDGLCCWNGWGLDWVGLGRKRKHENFPPNQRCQPRVSIMRQHNVRLINKYIGAEAASFVTFAHVCMSKCAKLYVHHFLNDSSCSIFVRFGQRREPTIGPLPTTHLLI